MRKLINQCFRLYYRYRYLEIMHGIQHPHETQAALLQQLIRAAEQTEWGRQYGYRKIKTPDAFSRALPVQDYESLKPFIQRMMYGEKDVLWSDQVRWFSKSSGTTEDKSKFIPVSRQNLRQCHIRGTWDTMACFYHNRPDARQFECKSMIMGGSLKPFAPYPQTMTGDVSAVMISHMPWVGRPFFIPDFKTALLEDWEEKLELLALAGIREPQIVLIGGVPTWTLVLFRKILEITGKSNMEEVWPELQGYVHGGVSFLPYRKQFEAYFPSGKLSYQETYNATEGFFAVQDDFNADDLLLLLNNGVYYEFLPAEEWGAQNPRAIPLRDVEVGKNYALVISTNAGLWRYMLGDTVVFTSTYPYKIKITGRTKQFVNAFGEEVVVENTDKALAETCRELNAIITEYTVAPIYFNSLNKGGHEWLIEFEQMPNDLKAFERLLDQNLQKINSDYEAKRFKSIALAPLKAKILPRGTFHNWMKSKGKLGGQHKVPRLANHRRYIEEILDFLQGSESAV